MDLETMLTHFDERTEHALSSVPEHALLSRGFDSAGREPPVDVEAGGRIIGEDARSAQIYLAEYAIPRFDEMRLVPGRESNGAPETMRVPVLIRPVRAKKKDANPVTGEPAVYTPPRPRIAGVLTPSSGVSRYDSGQIANVTGIVSVRDALGTRYLESDMLLIPRMSGSSGGEPDRTLKPVWETLTGNLPPYSFPTAEVMRAHNHRFAKVIEDDVKRFPSYEAGFDVIRFE